MGVLILFTAIALGGCVFLLYFLYALWRDATRSRTQCHIEARTVLPATPPKSRLLHVFNLDELRERERL